MKQSPERMEGGNSSLQAASAEAHAVVMRQVELMTEVPAKALTLWQSVATTWLGRRTEDMRLCMEMTQHLAGCKDIGHATEIYTGWVTESVRRLQEEVSAIPEQIRTLGNQCVNTIQGLANAELEKVAPSTTSAIRRAA